MVAVPVPRGGTGVGAGPDVAAAGLVSAGGGGGVLGTFSGSAPVVSDGLRGERFGGGGALAGASWLAVPGTRVSSGFLPSAKCLCRSIEHRVDVIVVVEACVP